MYSHVSRFALLFWAVSLALLTALPARTYAQGNTGSVTGLIIDSSHQGVSGAAVTGGGKTATTDATGHYTLTSITAGPCGLNVTKPLYYSASAGVTVVQNTTVTAPTLSISPITTAAGSVTGLIIDSSHQGVSGAAVTGGGKTATTDATGHYTLTSIAAGLCGLNVTKPLYYSASVGVTVVQNTTVTAPTLSISSVNGSIAGRVTDASTAAAISGATVSLVGTTLSVTTDASGSYRFGSVSTGSRTLIVSAPSYQSAAQTTIVASSGTFAVSFSLQKAVIAGPGSSIFWNGVGSYLLGANYAWYNYGTDFGTGGWGKYTNWSQIGTDFGIMHSQGVKVVRWWIFADGRYSPEWAGSGNTAVAGLDAQFFADVDTALKIAHDNNVYLIPCLVDFYMWKAPQTSGSVTGGGHTGMVTDATIQQSYLDNALKPFLLHVAASPYKNNVLGYDIVNEPEWTIKEIWNGALPLSQVQTFVRNCTSYIHTYGGGAYATVGAGTPIWAKYWMGLGLDFYQVHYYPGYDNYNGNGTPGSGLPTYASLNLDKPCIVGEFATADANYTFGSTQPLSAQWYLDTIYSYGYAGALGWGYENMDSSSRWGSFQPVFTNWANTYSPYIGPK